MNVDKGSCQNISVTLVKGLALRVGLGVSAQIFRLLGETVSKYWDPPGGPLAGRRTSPLGLFPYHSKQPDHI